MSDILSQGGDRDPRPWRRWAGSIAVLVLVTLVIVQHLPRHRHEVARSRAAAASHTSVPAVPLSLGRPGPGGVSGMAMSRDGSLRLPVTGPRPAWFWPATGREKPIGGLPRHQSGYQFTRVSGGWAVQANPGSHLRCGTCAGPRAAVYFLAGGAQSATLVGTADEVAPGASARSLWLTSYPPGADMTSTASTAQEVSITGAPAGFPLRLPARYVIDQATDRGLLLAPVVQPGTAAYRLWNPAGARASRSFERVMAASAGRSPGPRRAARSATCGCCTWPQASRPSLPCPGQVRPSTARSAPTGSSSPSRSSSSSAGDEGALAMQLDVASLASSRPAVVPGTSVSSDALVSFGWSSRGDDLVAELSFIAKVQVVSWHPGARQLAVAVINPGPQCGSLILR